MNTRVAGALVLGASALAWIAPAGSFRVAHADAVSEAGPAAPGPQKVTLQVTASGFKGTKGQVLFVLYANSDTWLKPEKAFRLVKLPVSGAQIQYTFTDLEPGVYAVSVIHDENTNGKLDMHWFPIPGPDEGAGVSNDATATVGPPSFSGARFQLGDRGGIVSLKIRY